MKAFIHFVTVAAGLLAMAGSAWADAGDDLLATGIDYAYGRNGKVKNEAQALQCYLQAADAGNAEAAYRLGRMYLYGVGTKVDKAKSKQFYTLAAQSGHKKAAQELMKNFKVKVEPTAAGKNDSKSAGLAPAVVKGKVLLLDLRAAKVQEYSHDTQTYGKEKAWEGDGTVTWEFDKSTTPEFEGGYEITYTKTGADTATVKVSGWEYESVYKLQFTSATTGTAEEEAVAEADQWKTCGIKFTLKDAAASGK